MVNVAAVEVPPAGAGLKTVTAAVPTAATSLAGIVAWSWVLLPYVVVRSTPFHLTRDAGTKAVPVTVRLNVGPPTVVVAGINELTVGGGLLTVMVRPTDVPPPGG